MCLVGQDMRRPDVENGRARRATYGFVPRMTMAGRASGSLGDRCARRRDECHKEYTRRTGEEEAGAIQKSRAVATRSCLLPR